MHDGRHHTPATPHHTDAVIFRGQIPPQEAPEYSEPQRNWRRILAMTGVWILILIVGSLLAPTIAESGAPPDSYETPPDSAASAVHRYLYDAASVDDEDHARAWSVLCEGAEPALGPDEVRQIVLDANAELESANGVDFSRVDEGIVTRDEVTDFPVIFHINGIGRRINVELTFTLKEFDGTWCVADLDYTPTAPEDYPATVTGEYLHAIDEGDLDEAAAMQCDDYTGLSVQAIAEITQPILSTAQGVVFYDPTQQPEQSSTDATGQALITRVIHYTEQTDEGEMIDRAAFTIVVAIHDTLEATCIAESNTHEDN